MRTKFRLFTVYEMGIKSFFSNVAQRVGKFAGKVWNGVKAAGKFVGKIAKPVLNTVAMLPGKIGLIGKAGSAGLEFAKNIVDRIPNQAAKDKLNQYIDKGQDLVNKAQDKAQSVVGKVTPYAEAGLSLMNKPPTFNMNK